MNHDVNWEDTMEHKLAIALRYVSKKCRRELVILNYRLSNIEKCRSQNHRAILFAFDKVNLLSQQVLVCCVCGLAGWFELPPIVI